VIILINVRQLGNQLTTSQIGKDYAQEERDPFEGLVLLVEILGPNKQTSCRNRL
jgi:hypothetical protein